MSFLFEDIEAAKRFGLLYRELPQYIKENLNPAFDLRPYQESAFRNFITYFESPSRQKPTQTLFHMATGSGKTQSWQG